MARFLKRIRTKISLHQRWRLLKIPSGRCTALVLTALQQLVFADPPIRYIKVYFMSVLSRDVGSCELLTRASYNLLLVSVSQLSEATVL